MTTLSIFIGVAVGVAVGNYLAHLAIAFLTGPVARFLNRRGWPI